MKLNNVENSRPLLINTTLSLVSWQQIRDETETKIELPAEGSDSDLIVISGRKENVEVAKDKVQAIQNELANITTIEVSIPPKFHNLIIGAKGRLIRSIAEECGGVHIKFPIEGSGSDKVIVRGPKSDVEKAKKQLVELANEKVGCIRCAYLPPAP